MDTNHFLFRCWFSHQDWFQSYRVKICFVFFQLTQPVKDLSKQNQCCKISTSINEKDTKKISEGREIIFNQPRFNLFVYLKKLSFYKFYWKIFFLTHFLSLSLSHTDSLSLSLSLSLSMVPKTMLTKNKNVIKLSFLFACHIYKLPSEFCGFYENLIYVCPL